MTPQDYIEQEEPSIQRNPLLARILYYSKDIEHFGTGLKRIDDECKAADVRYEFKQMKRGFKVIFYRRPSHEGEVLDGNSGKIAINSGKIAITAASTLGDADKVLIERAQIILDYIDANGSIVNKEAREALGLKEASVRKVFAAMTDVRLIEAVGDNKNRAYRRPPQ